MRVAASERRSGNSLNSSPSLLVRFEATATIPSSKLASSRSWTQTAPATEQRRYAQPSVNAVAGESGREGVGPPGVPAGQRPAVEVGGHVRQDTGSVRSMIPIRRGYSF